MDTSPWSPYSSQTPWLPCSGLTISSTGSSVSPFRDFYLSSLKNPTVCLGCLTVAVKNVPIGQRQPIITLRLASRVGLTQDDLPGPQLMISVVEPFVTVCGERFHLFTHQSLSSGLLRVLRPSSDIHLPVYSACPNDQTSLR